jgi:hypothetical protein
MRFVDEDPREVGRLGALWSVGLIGRRGLAVDGGLTSG